MATFTPALAQQPDIGFRLHGPEIFRIDCRRQNLRADTASTISVDHAGALANELPQADTMVLRLGTGRCVCACACAAWAGMLNSP